MLRYFACVVLGTFSACHPGYLEGTVVEEFGNAQRVADGEPIVMPLTYGLAIKSANDVVSRVGFFQESWSSDTDLVSFAHSIEEGDQVRINLEGRWFNKGSRTGTTSTSKLENLSITKK